MQPSMSALLSAMLLVAASGALAAPLPTVKCKAKGDEGALCLGDPCTASLCKPKSFYACIPNRCNMNTTYLGNKLPANPCSAVWIDTKTNKTVVCPLPVKPCAQNYAPVCGANKKTYPNSCFALADGTKVAFNGTCIFPPTCTKTYAPVCSKEGDTWPSACSAKYSGFKNYTNGACTVSVCKAACARAPGACKAANPCKNKAQYSCKLASCAGASHVFDDGSRADIAPCGAYYTIKATGFPAADCP